MAAVSNITVPLPTPTTFFVMVMAFIGSFQVFDLVMMVDPRRAGPRDLGGGALPVPERVKFFKMGYASAMAYVLLAVILVVTGYRMLFRKKMG